MATHCSVFDAPSSKVLIIPAVADLFSNSSNLFLDDLDLEPICNFSIICSNKFQFNHFFINPSNDIRINNIN